MAARSPGEALRQRMRLMQEAVSCVSPAVVRILEERSSGISISPGASVRLGGAVRLSSVIRQWVLPIGEPESRQWDVYMVGYSYELYRAGDEELLLYHWHPQSSSHLVEPHLHLGPSLLAALGMKRAVHLPTGQIALADFVGMLIREFGVRATRRDWRAVLENLGV